MNSLGLNSFPCRDIPPCLGGLLDGHLMEGKELSLGHQLAGDLRPESRGQEPSVHSLGSTAACLPGEWGWGAATIPLGHASRRFLAGKVVGWEKGSPDLNP